MPEPIGESMFLSSKLFADNGAIGIFSLRYGGTSTAPFDSLNLGYGLGDDNAHVDANMHRFLKNACVPATHTAHQCHGIDILECEGPAMAHNKDADILISEDPGAAVGVRVADCVPILLADPRLHILAAVHAGWRGTALHAVKHTVQAMQSRGSNPSELLAAIGPAIGRCCYVIGGDTAKQLGYPESSEAFECIDGHIHADLALLNLQQLTACGLPSNSIDHLAACTACQPDLYFSYRRDHGLTGRHLAVAAWAPAP